MIRTLQPLLALISLLLLALLAARVDGARWQEPDPDSQVVPAEPAFSAKPHVVPAHHGLLPRSQPATHLQGQPFAYGYFGARAQSTASFHRNARADWYQWSVRRAD